MKNNSMSTNILPIVQNSFFKNKINPLVIICIIMTNDLFATFEVGMHETSCSNVFFPNIYCRRISQWKGFSNKKNSKEELDFVRGELIWMVVVCYWLISYVWQVVPPLKQKPHHQKRDVVASELGSYFNERLWWHIILFIF